jgi:hypothetical protein
VGGRMADDAPAVDSFSVLAEISGADVKLDQEI